MDFREIKGLKVGVFPGQPVRIKFAIWTEKIR